MEAGHTDLMLDFIQKGLLPRAITLTGDLENAKDLVQDICLKFLENPSRYSHLTLSEQKGILNVSMKNEFINQYRAKKARPIISTDEYPMNCGQLQPDHDSIDMLKKIIHRQDRDSRALIMSAQGYRGQELAEHFGTCENNVRAYVRRARIKLKKEFRGLDDFVYLPDEGQEKIEERPPQVEKHGSEPASLQPVKIEKCTPKEPVIQKKYNHICKKVEANPCCKYVQYYLGARFRMSFFDGMIVEGEAWSVTNYGAVFGSNYINLATGKSIDVDIQDIFNEGDFQLYLIDPTEMSKSQSREYYALCKKISYPGKATVINVDTPASLEFLFINHIDAFDLVENGHALRATKARMLKKDTPFAEMTAIAI